MMKRLAPLLALVFFVQNVALGSVLEPAPRLERRPLPLPAWLSPALNQNGLVQSLRQSPVPYAKTVIVVQDAHLLSDAQESLAGVIDGVGRNAEENGHVVQIGLEGTGRSEIDFSRYESHPFRRSLRETAEAFLKKNIINGAEFAVIGYLGAGGEGSINSPFVVSGLEDQVEYDANVEALKMSERMKLRAEKSLKELADGLQKLKDKHYSLSLLEFDQKFSAYESGTLSVPGYALYLDSIVPANTPQMKSIIAASLIESSLNLERSEKERGRFITEMLTNLNKLESEKLIQTSRLLRSGLLTHGDYYRILRSMAEEKKISLAPYSEMRLYMEYVDICERINHEQLFEEIDVHEQVVQSKLALSQQEREIARLSKAYALMKKLVERRLTEYEWKKYTSLKDTKQSYLRDFERFYELANQRSGTMARRMEKAMERSGAQAGILVAGGFHANSIFTELSRRGFNVVLFSPRVTNTSLVDTSLDYLVTNRQPIDQLFTGERLFLNIAPATAGPHARELADAILAVDEARRTESGQARVGTAMAKRDGDAVDVHVEPGDVSFFGLTATEMVQILLESIPSMAAWHVLEDRMIDKANELRHEITNWRFRKSRQDPKNHLISGLVEFLHVRDVRPLEEPSDYLAVFLPIWAKLFLVPEMAGQLWDAASLYRGDFDVRREMQFNLDNILSHSFQRLGKQIEIEYSQGRRRQDTMPPYIYLQPHPQNPAVRLLHINEAALKNISKTAAYLAERAAEHGILLDAVESRRLAQGVLFIHEVAEGLFGISHELLVQNGLADDEQVRPRVIAGHVIEPFFTIAGVAGQVQDIVIEKATQESRANPPRHDWAAIDGKFKRVPLPGQRATSTADTFRAHEMLAIEGLRETQKILEGLVGSPNQRVSLSYDHIRGELYFNDRGLMSLKGLMNLMAAPEHQRRHRLVDDTVNNKKKIFVNASEVYEDAGVGGRGTLVVWDQHGGYHDVLVYADKLMKDRRRDIKEIAVLEKGAEFTKGLEAYLKFLLSDTQNGDDADTEIALATRINTYLKDGRLKLLSLPDNIEVPLIEDTDQYDLTDAAVFFDQKADDRNCGRVVFVSDWRRLMYRHQFRTTIEILTNLNVFVTTVDGVLKIATYAAKQA